MTLLAASLLLAAIASVWVVYPLLFRRWRMTADAVPAAVLDRDARRRVALAALKDVEYDHAAGKLDEEDYREMRHLLEMEALEAVRAARSDDRPAPAGTVGPHTCGFVNPAASRFCAGCGAPLR